jgi:hypothetical protein
LLDARAVSGAFVGASAIGVVDTPRAREMIHCRRCVGKILTAAAKITHPLAWTLTTPFFPDESYPQGDCDIVTACPA